MNTRFKVFASYNILQYLCDLSMFLYLWLSQNAKKSQINKYSGICGVLDIITHHCTVTSGSKLHAGILRAWFGRDSSVSESNRLHVNIF